MLGETAVGESRGAESGASAPGEPADPDLGEVISAWSVLSEPMRRGILAMVRSVVGDGAGIGAAVPADPGSAAGAAAPEGGAS